MDFWRRMQIVGRPFPGWLLCLYKMQRNSTWLGRKRNTFQRNDDMSAVREKKWLADLQWLKWSRLKMLEAPDPVNRMSLYTCSYEHQSYCNDLRFLVWCRRSFRPLWFRVCWGGRQTWSLGSYILNTETFCTEFTKIGIKWFKYSDGIAGQKRAG